MRSALVLDEPPESSVVSSPKYQTLPSTSWANQSSVSSTRRPPPSRTTSCTTTQTTPSTTRVRAVTVTTLCSTPASVLPT